MKFKFNISSCAKRLWIVAHVDICVYKGVLRIEDLCWWCDFGRARFGTKGHNGWELRERTK
jgi:hypothetical protein